MTQYVLTDDEQVRIQVTAAIAEAEGLGEVVAVDSPDRLRESLRAGSASCVLVDEALGGVSALAVTQEISRSHPLTPVVLLSRGRSVEVLTAAMDAGARTVLAVPLSLEELNSRLQPVLAWSQAVRNEAGSHDDPGAHRLGSVTAIVGAKGGVGASTVALMTAAQLARRTRTCLVDLDVRGGDLAAMTGLSARRSIADLVDIAAEASSRELSEVMYPLPGGIALLPAPDHGEMGEAVTETAERLKKQGRRVKFLYTIPNFNNPSGVTQPAERRRRVIESCAEAGVLVVEDNPYGLLTLDSGPLPAMRSLDTNVVYLGSFSKTFAPGFRVGWVCAPHGVRERLVLAQESATLCPPVFSQFAISNYLENCDWRGQIGVFRNMYRTRRDAMLATLEREMPDGCSWTRPAGGFFVWVTLPEGLDASTMLPRGVGARVAFVPGPAFFADGQGSRNVRLSYCFPPPDRIATGVERFAQVVRSELEMLRTFGMHTPSHANPAKGPGPNLN